MSFDLILYRGEGATPLTAAEIHSVLGSLSGLGVPDDSVSLEGSGLYFYQDPETKNYAQFEIAEVSSEDSEAYGIQCVGPAIHFYTGWSNDDAYLRREMSAVVDIARRLQLRILDPQAEGDSSRQPMVEDLIRMYRSGSEFAEGVMQAISTQGEALPTAPKQRLDYWREYAEHEGSIQQVWSAVGMFVPDQMILVRRGKTGAVQMVVWPDCICTVFPEADYVHIGRKKRGFLGIGSKQEQGLAPFSRIKAILGSDLQCVTSPVVHYVYNRLPARPEVVRAIASLDLIPLQEYRLIQLDEVQAEG